MEHQFYVLDVFTNTKFEGNQLAVFPFSEGISNESMQNIAREFNYSETVFITSTSNKNIKNVRIFTPASEVNFAGHPNIGAAMLLAKIGEYSDEKQIDIIFKEKIGAFHLEYILKTLYLKKLNYLLQNYLKEEIHHQ